MKPILIVYATRQGHTKCIAEHLAARLRALHFSADIFNAAETERTIPVTNYSAAILGASLQMGKFEPEMATFVKGHATDLQRIPSIFVSVSLAQRTVDEARTSEGERTKTKAWLQKVVEDLQNETGWRASQVISVAGALMYSKYGFVTRFLMKRGARKSGGPVDTSRDYVFTDWAKLDRIVEEFVLNAIAA